VIFLSPRDIVEIHEFVIEAQELQGMARDRSVEAIIGRIDNRIAYGMINDPFELSACYACYLSVGRAFHDANERTAFAAMDVCLCLNGISLDYDAAEIGALIVKAAQGIVDESELADWLRSRAR